MIESGRAGELVAEGEAYHDMQLMQIAQEICSRPAVKVVLIAGPSSSGKTSTSHKLCRSLASQGKKPVALSLDNWYMDAHRLPLKADGSKDYESVYAIDLKQLEADLNALIAGKEIALPTFNFVAEKSEYRGERLRLEPQTILIIEGIHALNPILTENIGAEHKYRVYASPMSSVSLDGERWVPTYVHRLLRRMSRDLRTRGKSVEQTIANWPSVIEGEAQWIEPFRGEADVFFDTTMLYELPALKQGVELSLQSVSVSSAQYEIAAQLLFYLSFFAPIAPSLVPPTSILREFIGGSAFQVA